MPSLHDLLHVHLAKDIPVVKGKIIEVDSHTPLEEAFSLIVDNNVSSAPVWDVETSKYLGFLDVRDLVAFAVMATHESEQARGVKELVFHGSKHHHTKGQGIVSVAYLCRRNPYKPVSSEATLADVCRILSSGAHRVPVVDASGRTQNIISQSSIVSFLASHAPTDEYLNKTVEELQLGTSPVLSVQETDSALATFTELDRSGRSGIAVVDPSGSLVANTSGSDIKLYLKQHETLHQPIIEFLNKIRRLELTTRAPIFVAKPSDPIHKVVAKLAATRAHRMFIVDDDMKPLRVVSLTDIIRVILKA